MMRAISRRIMIAASLGFAAGVVAPAVLIYQACAIVIITGCAFLWRELKVRRTQA